MNKLLQTLKYVISILVIMIASITVFYLNVQAEQTLLPTQNIQHIAEPEKQNANGLLNATKNIIKREGKVSDKVAHQYATWIFDAAAKHAVDPMLILSVIFVESRFNHKAITSGNVIGMMQISGHYHRDKATKSELFNPKKNIQVGTRILKEYSDKSKSTIETLLRYNGSLGKKPTYANKVLKHKRKFEAEVMKEIMQ